MIHGLNSDHSLSESNVLNLTGFGVTVSDLEGEAVHELILEKQNKL